MPRLPEGSRSRVKHPWARWFRGKTFTVRAGRYDCTQLGLNQQIRNAAQRYGVRVKIRNSKDGDVRVEILRDEGGASAEASE